VSGYLASALAYSVLLALMLTRWRRRLTGSGLAVAVGTQLVWSATLAAQAAGSHLPLGVVVAIEYLRSLAWALALTRCLRGANDPQAVRAGRQVLATVAAVCLLVLLWALGSLLPGQPEPLVRYLGRYWLWGAFSLAIGGLVLVEQVARNTRASHRWQLKYVWLAIGGLYAWDLCLFALAMLRGSAVNDLWLARGFVNTLLAILLAVGLRRIEGWQSAAFLSPRVVFFNATLLAAALYVLVMAAGSYMVRRLGGSWGAAGQALFLAAAGLVLIIAVLSEQFRAWARVMLAKHLFPYRYDYRSEWQKLTRALSEGAEPVYERIAKVMAGFVSAASAGLWLRNAEGGYSPVGGDLAPAEAAHVEDSREFFEFLRNREWIFDLDEARSLNPRGAAAGAMGTEAAGLQPPGWLLSNSRLWLIVPLICDQALVGFVVIGQPLVATRLGWEEIDLLRAAGRQVASFLAFEQAAKRLAEAHQFEAMNRLSAVLMHDLRHLIAQQALVVQNATKHRGNPAFFDDAILTIDNSVKRMTRLMEELRSGVLEGEAHRVELSELCGETVRRCAARPPVPTLEIHERGVEVLLHRERLLQVLEHIIRNAQDAAASEGTVTVHLRRSGSQATIEVSDSGPGMDAEFVRNRLFRPFDSTKGEGGFGIGAYQAREFVRKCGGSVEVDTAPGRGTRFIIHLPLAPALVTTDNVATSYEFQTS
jgi:putative PEP-CTERM system histidine kinase